MPTIVVLSSFSHLWAHAVMFHQNPYILAIRIKDCPDSDPVQLLAVKMSTGSGSVLYVAGWRQVYKPRPLKLDETIGLLQHTAHPYLTEATRDGHSQISRDNSLNYLFITRLFLLNELQLSKNICPQKISL